MATMKYFGYASCLAEYKVGLRCSSCKFDGLGRLLDHALEFGDYSIDWHGGSATLRKEKDSIVWGTIWSIDETDVPTLDEQEGVMTGKYKAITLDVLNSDGQTVKCRAYEQIGGCQGHTPPSPQYLAVIVDGAKARGLPAEYVTKLEKVSTNTNEVITGMMKEIREKRALIGMTDRIF